MLLTLYPLRLQHKISHSFRFIFESPTSAPRKSSIQTGDARDTTDIVCLTFRRKKASNPDPKALCRTFQVKDIRKSLAISKKSFKQL